MAETPAPVEQATDNCEAKTGCHDKYPLGNKAWDSHMQVDLAVRQGITEVGEKLRDIDEQVRTLQMAANSIGEQTLSSVLDLLRGQVGNVIYGPQATVIRQVLSASNPHDGEAMAIGASPQAVPARNPF